MEASVKQSAVLSGPRASSLALGCPRQAYYQAVDAPARAPSEQMQRWWRRGHAISDAIRGEIVSELREAGQRPRREEPIPWPAAEPVGVGHADVYVPADRRVIEITSTAGADLQAHKARQAALYTLEHPRAEEAFVLAVDPQSYVEHWFPVNVDALRPEVVELEQELVSALRQGAPPARRCQRPSDAEQYRCAYADHCFADWTPEYPDSLLDPGVVDLVDLLAQADSAVREARAEVKTAEQERDELRDQLRPLVPVNAEVECGEHRVRLSVHERRSFSLAQAAAAGHALPAELAAFSSVAQVERWTVK